MGLGKFRQKGVTSYTFFSQYRLSQVFEGTWKVSTKRCDQLHIFFAVQTILSFWWDLESFDKKLWPVAHFWQYRLSQVFDGAWKKFHKEVCPVTRCVRCGDYLKFWMGLRKVSCAQLHVFAKIVCTAKKMCDWSHLFVEIFLNPIKNLKIVCTAKKMCNWSHLFVETFQVPSKTQDSLRCETCNWAHIFVETFRSPIQT